MEDSKALDWANLARYEDDNLKVGLPKKDERRVVFMGDSITEEWSNPVSYTHLTLPTKRKV